MAEESLIAEEETVREKADDKLEQKKSSTFYKCFVATSLVVAVIVIWVSITQNEVNISDLWSSALDINVWYLVGAVVFVLLGDCLEGARIQVILYRIRKKPEPILCLKTAMLGRCYDLLTPLMLGGKPYQLGYYYSRGLSGSESTSVTLSDFLAMKLGFAITSVFVLIFCGSHLSAFGDDWMFMSMAIGGVAVALFFAVVTLFISLNKRITVWMASVLIALGVKLKMVKDKEASLSKTNKTLHDYRTAFRALVCRPFAVASMLVMTALVYVSYTAVVFLIYAAFFGFDFSVFPVILLAVILFENIMGVVPLPGGTGGVEIAFFTMFTVLFGAQVGVAFLIWKIVTFILPIFTGSLVMTYDAVWGNKKLHRKKTCGNINHEL